MKKCIISFKDSEIIDKLISLGFDCIPVIPSDRVSEPISAHSDVLYKKGNDNEIIVSCCQKANFGLLEQLGYSITSFDELNPGYKTESYLNFIENSRYIICHPKTAFVDYSTDKKIIEVRQGYTRCSCIELNETAYITDDESIFKALTKNGINCLIISKGDVSLNGYNYGFIGGASVKISASELLFFGDFVNFDEKKTVIDFCKNNGINPIFMEGKQLTDIGSAFIL